jgi:ATP phosphoribosyltransferase
MSLSIALPNKGRLADSARALLREAGFDVDAAPERALEAELAPGLAALFVRARDIPEYVADGAADLGVTGGDLVEESGRPVTTLLDLGLGRCRLVLARPAAAPPWPDNAPPDDLRVATAFPRLTTGFFERLGRRVTLVPVSGAAEVAPRLGVADAIVDLVSTGSTLRENGLVETATLLESTARLIARGDLSERPDAQAAACRFATTLEAVLSARDRRYLMANVPKTALDAVRRLLPGISGPTIVGIDGSRGHVAAHAVVPRGDVDRVLSELRALGAEGILVTRIERLLP